MFSKKKNTGSRDSQIKIGNCGTQMLLPASPPPPQRISMHTAKGLVSGLSPSRPGPRHPFSSPEMCFFRSREKLKREDTNGGVDRYILTYILTQRCGDLWVALVGRWHVEYSLEAWAHHLPIPHTRGHGLAPVKRYLGTQICH